MSVIINDTDTVYLTTQLEATRRASKLTECFYCFFMGETKQVNDSKNCKRVMDIMLTRHLQRDSDRVTTFITQVRQCNEIEPAAIIGLKPARLHPVGTIDCHLTLHTVRNNIDSLFTYMCDQSRCAYIFRARDQCAIRRQEISKLFKSRIHRLRRREEVWVVMFNTGHNCDLGL